MSQLPQNVDFLQFPTTTFPRRLFIDLVEAHQLTNELLLSACIHGQDHRALRPLSETPVAEGILVRKSLRHQVSVFAHNPLIAQSHHLAFFLLEGSQSLFPRAAKLRECDDPTWKYRDDIAVLEKIPRSYVRSLAN
jgi:hypothetical protein